MGTYSEATPNRPGIEQTLLLTFLLFTCLGCGTPMAVKRLSAEQVKHSFRIRLLSRRTST